jgi:hypothetical protein
MAHSGKHDHSHTDAQHNGDNQSEHDALHDCIEECLNCHVACTMTVQHCLATGGAHAEVNLAGVLLDCAEMCQTSANFMLRGSPYHILTCAACAELCRVCEETCRSIADDEQLAHCADVCAACAESCEQMTAADDEDD